MARIIKLKNTTAEDIVIFGWVLEPSVYFTVDPIEYVEFARNDVLFGYVSTSDIIVNNGDIDLIFPTEAWRHVIGEPNDLAIKDGDNLIFRDDKLNRSATNGVLLHGFDREYGATAIRSIDNELSTNDLEAITILQEILKELIKLNMYNAHAHDFRITNMDIEDDK